MQLRSTIHRDSCSWRDIKPPGRDGWGKNTTRRTEAILAYLATHGLATAREIHEGATLDGMPLESPSWRPRDTANRLLVLLGRGKVKRRRCGIYEYVPGAAV